MSESTLEPQDTLAKQLGLVLNEHGHAFHYTVLRVINEIVSKQYAAWRLVGTEIPVEVRNQQTKIDFILERRYQWPDHSAYYLLAECKRINPAFSNWCFIKAPYVRDRLPSTNVFWEQAQRGPSMHVGASSVRSSTSEQHAPYHIAIELKSNQAGDKTNTKFGGAIEEPAGQVLRGSNGMLEFLSKNPEPLDRTKGIVIVPTIFTTANLWVCDADLSTADLATGNLDTSALRLDKRPWLLYEYNMGPGLKHTLSMQDNVPRGNELATIVEREYVRTIAVVNSAGIQSYFQWLEYFSID